MENILTYIRKGFEYKNNGSYKQAIEMFYKALELENNNVEILFQLGELYFLLDNMERAEHYFKQVLVIDSKHEAALGFMEKICHNSKRLEEALKYAQKLVEVKALSDSILKLVAVYKALHDIDGLRTLEKHDIPEVKKALAKSYYELGYPDDALKLLEHYPNDNCDKIILGKIYFDKGDFQKSQEIFESLKDIKNNPDVSNYLGLFAIENGDFTDAIKYLSEAVCIDKMNPTYHYNLANAYFYNGWFKEATTSYLNAIKLDNDNMDYRYSLAYLYWSIKEFAKCKSEVKYILSVNENHYRTRVLEALLKLENKDYIGAQQILETNIKSGSDDEFTLISLAKVYKCLNYYDKAEKIIKDIISKYPESLEYYCELASLYVHQKNYEKALSLVKNVIEKSENYIEAYIIGAQCAYKLGDYNTAKSFSKNIIALDVNCAQGYFWLGKCRLKEGDIEEAFQCVKRAIMYDLNNPEYYVQMSQIYERKGDVKSALEYAKEAESINPGAKYKELCARLVAENRKVINEQIKNLPPKNI